MTAPIDRGHIYFVIAVVFFHRPSPLHARAILGLPIPNIRQHGPSASYVILGEGESDAPAFEVHPEALTAPDTALRLFGKPEVKGHRRLGVGLARGADVDEARAKAKGVADAVRVDLGG